MKIANTENSVNLSRLLVGEFNSFNLIVLLVGKGSDSASLEENIDNQNRYTIKEK